MDNQKFCTMCGEPVGAGDAFCQACGAKQDVKVIETRTKQKKPGKKWIAVLAAIIIVAGFAVVYSLNGSSYSVDNVIEKTLALESGKIEISAAWESDGYDDDENIEIEFIKTKEEKTFLVEAEYETIYLSAIDGKFRIADGWTDEEFDYENKLGLDTVKLERDIADYLADSFKNRQVPDGYIEDLEVKKSGGRIVVSGNIEDEAGLLKWIYDCFDIDALNDLMIDNVSDNEDADSFINMWENAVDDIDDEISDGLDDLDTYLEDDYDIDSSFRIAIDKQGILDEMTLNIDIEDLNWDQSSEATITIEFTDKNSIDHIEEPDLV